MIVLDAKWFDHFIEGGLRKRKPLNLRIETKSPGRIHPAGATLLIY